MTLVARQAVGERSSGRLGDAPRCGGRKARAPAHPIAWSRRSDGSAAVGDTMRSHRGCLHVAGSLGPQSYPRTPGRSLVCRMAADEQPPAFAMGSVRGVSLVLSSPREDVHTGCPAPAAAAIHLATMPSCRCAMCRGACTGRSSTRRAGTRPAGVVAPTDLRRLSRTAHPLIRSSAHPLIRPSRSDAPGDAGKPLALAIE
jgi:hypothetical protein